MSEDKNNQPAAEEQVLSEETEAEANTMEESAVSDVAGKKTGNGLATSIATLALLIAAGSAGGLYWQYQQNLGQQAAIQDQFTQAKTQLADTQQVLENKIQQLQNTQASANDAQRNLEQSLASLHEEIGRDRNAWAIAETIYYLQLANARLQLLQDVDTALEALNIADKRLMVLGDPGFIPVRDKIKKEIAALEAVAKTDFSGTALSIGALVAQVPKLPLHAPANRAKAQVETAVVKDESEQPLWKQEISKAWDVMRELVEVRRTDKRIEPLLKPEEQQLLVQNIQLQLQTARIAVLQRDSALYKESLGTAASWINDAYDLDAEITRSTIEQINKLAAIELTPEVPDISASLRQLRAMSDKQARVTKK